MHRPVVMGNIDGAKGKHDACKWGAEQLDSREHELDALLDGELGAERRGERAVVSKRMHHQGYSGIISDNQRQSPAWGAP
jgi:hypothetical protein